MFKKNRLWKTQQFNRVGKVRLFRKKRIGFGKKENARYSCPKNGGRVSDLLTHDFNRGNAENQEIQTVSTVLACKRLKSFF
jgi:hypothetical protein